MSYTGEYAQGEVLIKEALRIRKALTVKSARKLPRALATWV